MIDRLLLDIGQHRRSHVGHPRLGVPHGRRGIALDRAEVPLPVDQGFPHRPRLGHVDQRG